MDHETSVVEKKECAECGKSLEAGSHRRRLPRDRFAVTHHFTIGDVDGYVTVGLYPDTDDPGEIFISVGKAGSTVKGLLDCLGIMTSMALQHGVPLKVICEKMSYTSFDPAGFTGEEFGFAKSYVDYIFRWLERRYVVPEVQHFNLSG